MCEFYLSIEFLKLMLAKSGTRLYRCHPVTWGGLWGLVSGKNNFVEHKRKRKLIDRTERRVEISRLRVVEKRRFMIRCLPYDPEHSKECYRLFALEG
jgi:hypothetical protein